MIFIAKSGEMMSYCVSDDHILLSCAVSYKRDASPGVLGGALGL